MLCPFTLLKIFCISQIILLVVVLYIIIYIVYQGPFFTTRIIKYMKTSKFVKSYPLVRKYDSLPLLFNKVVFSRKNRSDNFI